jgi:hypothetical protein
MTSFKKLALLIGAFVACTSLPALARGGGGGAGSAGSASSAPSAATAHQSTGITSTNPAQRRSIGIQNPALTTQPGRTATSPTQAGSAGSASSAPSALQSTGITSTNPAQPGSISIQDPALTAVSPAQPGTTAQPSTANAKTSGGPGAGASDQSVGIANTNPTQPGAIGIQNSGMTTQPATTATTPTLSRPTGAAGTRNNNAEAMRNGTYTTLQAGAVSAPGVGVGHAANGLPIGAPGSGLGSPEQPIGSGSRQPIGSGSR